MQLQQDEESTTESTRQVETSGEQLQQQIDKLKAENDQLHEQLARRDEFTAMIAHDLRGPLSPIINYAQMIARYARLPQDSNAVNLQQQTKKNSAILHYTDVIISQAQRSSRLVNDLLDTSHISTGTFQIQREECDIVKLVRTMTEQLQPVAPYHTLTVVAPRRAIQGYWDAGRLQQAIGNLLDNAVKYSDENTVVTVTVKRLRRKRAVSVSIHNEGASIPSNEVGQLFRPYSRLKNASGHKGSGLGLYITRKIIEAHNGILRVDNIANDESSTQGNGTTFTFEIPLTAPQAEPDEQKEK